MRLIAIYSLLLSTCVSCGLSNKFCDANADTLNGFCETVVGYDTQLEDRVRDLESSLSHIDTQMRHEYAGLYDALHESNADKAQLWSLLTTETDNVRLIQNQVFLLDQQVAQQLYYIESLQTQLVDVQTRLTEVSTRASVVKTVDFCGDHPAKVDEVGLVLETGEIVVYFQGSGGNRLSVLKSGSYKVTDGSGCCFDVDSNNNILNERTCH